MSTNAETSGHAFPPDVPLLHVYSPAFQHQEAVIVGNAAGIEALRNAMDCALVAGHGTADGVTRDGEGFVAVVLRMTEADIDGIPLPYTDGDMCPVGSWPGWGLDRIRAAAADTSRTLPLDTPSIPRTPPTDHDELARLKTENARLAASLAARDARDGRIWRLYMKLFAAMVIAGAVLKLLIWTAHVAAPHSFSGGPGIFD